MWGVARFVTPARRTAPFTVRWSTDSCRWCRRRWRVFRSTYSRVAGKIHCHTHPPARVRILPPQRRGQLDPTRPVLKITRVLLPNALEMPGQIRLQHLRQHRHPVLVALARTHHDLVAPEVHVLDSKAATLEQAQARPVEQVAISRGTPSSGWRTARTSSRVRITGSRCGRFARTTPSSQGRSSSSTAR